MGEGIVDTGDDNQEVGEDGQDLVSPDGLNIVGFASCEGVCWEILAGRESRRNERLNSEGMLELVLESV